MFLITTADQRFWKTDEPVLFLGEWCKVHSQKALWQNMQQEVLAYHWDDRKKLFQDYQYLQGLYKRVLADMTRSLNALHGENHSVRYWEIIIGPWLFYFIHIFYDRYRCIERAAQSNKVTDTIIGQYAQDEWISKDYNDFSEWVLGDAYNYFLYGWIIEHTKPFPYRYQHAQMDSQVLNIGRKKKAWVKQSAKKLILGYESCLPHRLNRHVFISSHLSPLDQWRLQLSLRQWPSLFAPEVEVSGRKVNWNMRDRLCLSCAGDPFEKLLFQILIHQIPQAYVEEYVTFKKCALSKYPSRPKTILTANDLYSNEGFKFFSAHYTEKGARLAAVQHGGLYGQALCHSTEEHEISVSDAFYTWGWKSDEASSAQPLAAAKLNAVKSLRSNPQGNVLMAMTTFPRYAYRLYSIPMAATGMLGYLNDQFRFVSLLSQLTRENLIVRLFKCDYEWSQEQRWREDFQDIELDYAQEKMMDKLKECRLFVGNYNATTYLETFAANFPTIIFWDPKYWETRLSAQKYLDELRQVGILHDTPESAARKVNAIFADPMGWWQQEDVQRAKNMFCERFVKTSDHWLQEWQTELLKLANQPRGEKI